MQKLMLLSYRLIFRWLPPSTSPGGRFWRALRGAAARPLLARSGRNINVERGAFFPAGQVSLGDNSGIGIRCELRGPVSVGDNVLMGPEVVIFTEGHEFGDVQRPMRDQGMTPTRRVTIEDDVWIGQRVMILPGVTVGKGAILAAGAVVTKDVPPFTVVGGNPAKTLKRRE